ncbi:MAG: 3-dehydroquinate dehydratase, partial [Muribaculaceae bacterium]|nr:3-dehydroquinate dehydratase [Muribaculaceae bacterium]
MKILIINGPNLNLLGRREPEIYGSETMESCLARLSATYPVEYFQSNSEGAIIDRIHAAGYD